MFNDLIKKIYNKKVQAGEEDAQTWKATTEQYWQAIQNGWGKPFNFTSAERAILELRRNVNTYAAFKNHANIIELVNALSDEEGKRISFSEFKKKAQAINEKYNVNWLQAEYNYANAAAKSAAQWQGFVDRGGKLEYKTVGDGRVREAHRVLDGTILPVDHPFWKSYYPPNGWNCRCFVRWRPEDTQDQAPAAIPEVPPMFQNNVGITSQVFDDTHPFIKEITKEQADNIREQAERETIRFERGFIKSLAKDNLGGKSFDVTFKTEGSKKVNITSTGIKEAINQPHEDYLDKNRAILNIESLLKDAIEIAQVPNQNPEQFQIKMYHYFQAQDGDKVWNIVLREFTDGTIDFYSIVDNVKG